MGAAKLRFTTSERAVLAFLLAQHQMNRSPVDLSRIAKHLGRECWETRKPLTSLAQKGLIQKFDSGFPPYHPSTAHLRQLKERKQRYAVDPWLLTNAGELVRQKANQ